MRWTRTKKGFILQKLFKTRNASPTNIKRVIYHALPCKWLSTTSTSTREEHHSWFEGYTLCVEVINRVLKNVPRQLHYKRATKTSIYLFELQIKRKATKFEERRNILIPFQETIWSHAMIVLELFGNDGLKYFTGLAVVFEHYSFGPLIVPIHATELSRSLVHSIPRNWKFAFNYYRLKLRDVFLKWASKLRERGRALVRGDGKYFN